MLDFSNCLLFLALSSPKCAPLYAFHTIVFNLRAWPTGYTVCQKISIFLYVDWTLWKNATENEEGKSSGIVDGSVKFADFEKNFQLITCVRVTSKQQSTSSSSAHRHRLKEKWTKREAPMPFQPVRQQRKRII
ncbi:Protein CBG21139 [Caenorhabditis briggsae]|uniref:Protein CBG21139 n=1 Tax=Caenorhabditis briggsae TaxID=6238 RepID=A8XZE4_CAEBR|nr:Protein CBG21139 [Caenorhabditis briggsae]CAP38071.1 Protein CBG21139 [Caenorhabditis briggsae]